PTDDSSDLLSPLAARRLQPGDQAAPTNSTQPDQQQQQQQQHPLPTEPRDNDEEIAEHVDQFPAVSFQSSTAAEGGFDAESSARSSSSSSRALDPKEDRLLHRPLEAYSLSRAFSKDKGSSPFRSSRQAHPRSSVTSASSLNFVDESRRSNTPLSTAGTSIKLTPTSVKPVARPSIAVRRQSLVPSSQQRLINTLLEPSPSAGGDYFSSGLPSIHRDMINRKIWVKRPNSSPTLVAVTEEDLVDDLRDVILKKYSNSLGRTFDSPDIIIKLLPREPSSRQSSHERVLGPEEPVGRTLDTFYPGGQTVDEALIIEIPQRRTPKPSPRQHNLGYCHSDDLHPGESGEYFPPMAMIPPSNVSGSASNASAASSHHAPPVHSMSVITTGQLPPVPSPGSRGSWHQHQLQSRPKYGRQPTASPTVVSTSPNQNLADTTTAPINAMSPIPPPPSTSTPPAPSPEQPQKDATSPPARTSSPRPAPKLRKVKNRGTNGSLPTSLLDGTVPPINVLIVEDNIINLRLLEAFMKRLKVRWSTAMNGREAVNKWRAGGFHLVLMDIQLPVLSGLEATKEIRRYERLNNIGVFSRTVSGPAVKGSSSSSSPSSPVEGRHSRCPETLRPEDKLENPEAFNSPVIIVALTASSLQSDRNEALAAGCNDFLTKPVNMVWLEQKVTEWGCMQALIDFEGWRKWRKFDEQQNPEVLVSTTTTTTTTTTIPEPTGESAPLQHKKSHQNIHVSSNGGNGGSVKTVSSSLHNNHTTIDDHNAHKTTNEASTSQDSSTPVISANPIKQVPASTPAKEPSSNASSSAAAAAITGVANGSSKLDATSPGARSSTSTHSSGTKRTNRNSGGGVSPRIPKV
ncbi:hypothetical protein RJZ57_008414, partial [Blastomyces gilchristii]